MKIIVPMAGRGSRLRPHTLTIPKPLLPIAGKPIVQRLVEDIVKVCTEPVDEIAFIIGDFGIETEKELLAIAKNLGAKGTIYYQDKPLGTAHAILCAANSLDGNIIVAFADTLFKAEFELDLAKEGIIWVQKVENPSAFGVVKFANDGSISDFVEKPTEFVSDLAIIGIYYFKDGPYLKDELQYLIDNNITIAGGEFGLTTALENMAKKGSKFYPGEISEWLDCGNKDVTVQSNQRYLEFIKGQPELKEESISIVNSTIIEPVFIGKGAVIENSVVGPHVSIGKGTKIFSSIIKNTIIQENSNIKNLIAENSLIGNHVLLHRKSEDLSVGDYNHIK